MDGDGTVNKENVNVANVDSVNEVLTGLAMNKNIELMGAHEVMINENVNNVEIKNKNIERICAYEVVRNVNVNNMVLAVRAMKKNNEWMCTCVLVR
jgi:hypothetical protein